MQIDPVQLSPNQLVAKLNRLDVYFLQDETAPVMTAPMPPATLLMQLATSDEARLRLALRLFRRNKYPGQVTVTVHSPPVVRGSYWTVTVTLDTYFLE